MRIKNCCGFVNWVPHDMMKACSSDLWKIKFHFQFYNAILIITVAGTWWLHQMDIFSALLPFVRGIHRSPVNSDHKGQWRGALMFSLICALNKRLSKQSWVCWFDTQSRSLCRHWNETIKRITWATSHMYIYDCEINSPRNCEWLESESCLSSFFSMKSYCDLTQSLPMSRSITP